jgi:hypothetical protein
MDKTDPPILSPPNGLKKLHDPKAFQNSKLAFSKELMKIPSLKNNPKLQTPNCYGLFEQWVQE